jgi:hypothetical protein
MPKQNLTLDQLNFYIKTLEKKNNQGRKLLEDDLNMEQRTMEDRHENNTIKKYRAQAEYGEKKFIKP